MDRKHYYGLDIGKIFAAILVISLHTVPLIEYKGTNMYVVWEVISSLAVPFFFICTGFFIGIKMLEEGHEIIKVKALSFGRIYLILTIVYLPLTIYSYIEGGNGVIYCLFHFARGFIIYGNHGWSWQLWYLLCGFYSLLFIYYLRTKGTKNRNVWIILFFMYLFGVVMTVKPLQGKGYSGVDFFYDIYSSIFWNGRMFTGALFIWIGMELKNIKKPPIYLNIIALVLCLLLNLFCGSFLSGIIKPITVVFIVFILMSITNGFIAKKLHFRQVSSYVYYIHMYFVFITEKILKLNELQRFVIVSVVSVGVSYIYIKLKDTVSKYKMNTA